MIHCLFTLDYEIYGDGHGALRTLVLEPAERLRQLFLERRARFVTFVEAAELARIGEARTDEGIELVERQVRTLHDDGFEIGLHIHPQWCNARYQDGRWILDLAEYNLCTLSRGRIAEIVGGCLDYLRQVIGDPGFTPLAFRAGNWLFQPTRTAATVLAEHGLRLDSSVFKGGVQRNHGCDYRGALKNGDYWRFVDDVNKANPAGQWIEVPIYAQLVPLWKIPTRKRVAAGNLRSASIRTPVNVWRRLTDFVRFRYPLKLDYCRMTFSELTSMMDRIIAQDVREPSVLRPITAIGHTKDLSDIDTIARFLSFLDAKGVAVSTFSDVYPRLAGGGAEL